MTLPPILPLKSPTSVRGVIPAGAFFSSKLRRNESPSWVSVSARPRAESTTTSRSRKKRSRSKNAVIGAQASVRVLCRIMVAAPQFGWQPQESWPKSASGPFRWSVSAAKAVAEPSGYQSRSGSMRPP